MMYIELTQCNRAIVMCDMSCFIYCLSWSLHTKRTYTVLLYTD